MSLSCSPVRPNWSKLYSAPELECCCLLQRLWPALTSRARVGMLLSPAATLACATLGVDGRSPFRRRHSQNHCVYEHYRTVPMSGDILGGVGSRIRIVVVSHSGPHFLGRFRTAPPDTYTPLTSPKKGETRVWCWLLSGFQMRTIWSVSNYRHAKDGDRADTGLVALPLTQTPRLREIPHPIRDGISSDDLVTQGRYGPQGTVTPRLREIPHPIRDGISSDDLVTCS